MPFETFIAWRYFKAKRKQTFISMITVISLSGVAVGVMALIIVLAVMSGVQSTWKDKILGVNSHIVVLKYGQSITDYTKIISELESVKGVASAEPYILSQVMLGAFGGVSGAILKGIDPDLAARGTTLSQSMVAGRLDDIKDGAGSSDGPALAVILGKELAGQLGVVSGDSIRVISPMGRVTPLGGRAPRTRNLTVAGLFKSGMYEYDSTLAYISISQAQDFLNLGASVTGLEVRVDDIYDARTIKEAILARLGPEFWARDWMEMNRNLFWALKLEKLAMIVILSLIVLVAAFNIVSTLTIVVMQKARDIAILKSMGATSSNILKIFIFQGLVIGMAGTILGLIGGIVFSRLLAYYEFIKLPSDVYYIDTLPVRMEFPDVALVVCLAVTISFLATLYPAWQASRLNPVEALRYE
ncbi:MAG: lipoprotein-releasing ABC transporter permease subunit [Deltaproteobacteria bacterium]|nr:lipoprotein-releasing ABC transporter permease subunit [Deltaproteobacteria bacterium]